MIIFIIAFEKSTNNAQNEALQLTRLNQCKKFSQSEYNPDYYLIDNEYIPHSIFMHSGVSKDTRMYKYSTWF